MDMPHYLIEKCPCPCCRIEDLDTMGFDDLGLSFSLFIIFLDLSFHFNFTGISKTFWKIKVSSQNIINCSDDKLHDWCWSIEYSTELAKIVIIFPEKVLIKVNYRIMCLLLIQSMHEGMDIRMCEYFTELIDDIFETFLISLSCDMIEKSPKERIGFRDEITSLRTRERIGSLVMIASHEESIDERLSIEISEVVV